MEDPRFRAGDTVRILQGANENAIGVVDHSVLSSGEWLYLVQRGEAASWVEEDRLVLEASAET